MKIPKLLHGTYATVKKAAAAQVRALGKGAHFADVGVEVVESGDVPGLIVLQGPGPIFSKHAHFHAYVLQRELRRAWEPDAPRLAEVFDVSLASSWGLLGLMGQDA